MLNFISSLPGLLTLAYKILTLVLQLFSKSPESVIADTHEAIDELKKAKTKEEKLSAAKKIQDLISG